MIPPIKRIHAVTVCWNYSDFLEQAARINQPLFDDWVIVTHQEDKGTLAVCERYGLRVAYCPYFQRHGSSFNKALGINIGLAHTALNIDRNSGKGEGTFICHIDADTVLPRDFRNQLNNIPLDTTAIYGIDELYVLPMKIGSSILLKLILMKSIIFVGHQIIGKLAVGYFIVLLVVMYQ
jgi:hypothetical protein